VAEKHTRIGKRNHHNRFTTLFPGPPGWAGARRELLDFMVQGRINRGRHTDHLAGCHSAWLTSAHLHHSPIFYRPDALPAAQPTVSNHWRQLAHSIKEKMLEFSSTVLPALSPCRQTAGNTYVESSCSQNSTLSEVHGFDGSGDVMNASNSEYCS